MTREELKEIRDLAKGLLMHAQAQQAGNHFRESGVTFAAYGAIVALLNVVDPPKPEEAVEAKTED